MDIQEKELPRVSAEVATRPKEEEPSVKEHAGINTHSQKGRGRYYVEVVGKALDVLDILRSSRTDLRLTDIAEKAGLDISTAFRLLRTLEVHGYVLRDESTKRIKLCLGYRTYRVGYSQLSGDQRFSQKVTQGLIDAADKSRVELLVTDNRDSPEDAVKNAAWLISQKVDFVIEYEFHYRVGPVVANMFSKAGIPILAIDIPLPGAVYFGANNYAVGSVGGEALGRFAKENWRGRVDRVLLLEIPEAGPVPHARVIGTLDGMRSVLSKLNEKCLFRKDGKGTEIGGYLASRRLLRSMARREHLLIAAANDECARGAIRAVREAGREQITAIMAQGWGPDEALRDELRKADNPPSRRRGLLPGEIWIRDYADRPPVPEWATGSPCRLCRAQTHRQGRDSVFLRWASPKPST
jgi:ribose transport system substrate-binding protein